MWVSTWRFMMFFGGSRDREEAEAFRRTYDHHFGPDCRDVDQLWISGPANMKRTTAAPRWPGRLTAGVRAAETRNYSKQLPMEASPNTAHMFIVHPFSGGA
jgi:heat shock protein HtpX